MLYLITAQVRQKDGSSAVETMVREVPPRKTLADLGYPDEVVALAKPLPRRPKEDEAWDETRGRWERDREAEAHRERNRRARVMGSGELLERLEATERRLAAVEAANLRGGE